MPRDLGPVIRKKPKAKKRYTLPRGGSPDAADRNAGRRTPGTTPPPAPTPTARPGPYTDAERQQVARHKATPSWRNAIKQSYKQRSVPERREIVHNIEAIPPSKRTREQRAVLDTHAKRSKRDRTLINSLIFTDRQREIVAKHVLSDAFRHAREAAREAGRPDDENDDSLFEKALGSAVESTLGKLAPGLPAAVTKKAGETGVAMAIATGEDPIGVLKGTVKSGLLAVPAIPASLVHAVTNPIETATSAFTDPVKRHGESFDDKIERFKDEGILPEIADATILVGGVSAGLGKTLLRPRTARPAHRISGDVVRQRPDAHGYLGGAYVKLRDNRRGKKLERSLAEAEAGIADIDPLERAAAVANREAGRTVEVVPSRVNRKIVRDVAKLRGRSVYGLQRALGITVGEAQKQLAKLNKHENRALWYATALGIRTPDQARDLLPGLRDDMRANRETAGLTAVLETKPGRYKRSDMARQITVILSAPEKHFTDKLAETVEAVRPLAMKAGDEDPRYTPEILEARRYAPLAALLNMDRGVDADEAGRVIEYDHGHGVKKIMKADDLSDVRTFTIPPDRSHGVKGTHRMSAAQVAALDAKLQKDGFERAANDDGSTTWTRAAAANGDVPPLRYGDEHDLDFVARAQDAGETLGLAAPIYFRSEKLKADVRDYAAHAVGGGRAMAVDRRYRGKNLAIGLMDTSPEQFLRGLARNTKASHNWSLVDTFSDRHTMKDLVPEPEGVPMSVILDRANLAGVDLSRLGFYSPGIFRQIREDAPDVEADDFDAPELAGGAQITDAFKRATITADDAGSEKLTAGGKWKPVPLAAIRELEAELAPSGKLARGWDIGKGKTSRYMLAASPPWLAFQVVGEGLMTLFATSGRAANPKLWVDTYNWWTKDLTEADRAEVGGWLGLNGGAGSSVTQQKLGAVNLGTGRASGVVNSWRAMKASPVWHKPRVRKGRGMALADLNPLELMIRADRGKSNVFRLIAGFDKAKRQVVREMGENMGKAERLQNRVVHVLKKPEPEQFKALLDEPDLLEDMAEHVVDFLGDWTTLTAFERKGIGRVTMFYEYIRFSTRLVLWTMPAKHPVVLALLAELGALTVEEYREVFGDDQLPFNMGKVYLGEIGEGLAIDLRRANPALNALFDTAATANPGRLAGLMPPIIGIGLDQLSHGSLYSDRDWMAGGAFAKYGAKASDFNLETRARIIADDVMSLVHPYREAEKRTQEGLQGDDSLLFFDAPVKMGEAGTEASKASRAMYARDDAWREDHEAIMGVLLGQLYPTPSRDRASARERAYIKRLESREGKPRPKAPFGASSTGKPFGASSTGKPFGAGN